MSKSKVLFLMTGSIACYKACNIISRLKQANCEVQVVATPSALQFVGNSTLEGLSGRPVISDMYAPGNVMDHIHLMRWADLILVAPATANFINKAAQGVADDFVQTLFLAHDFKKPFIIAPAMNSSMYNHPITQKSLQTLRDVGITILATEAGILACGEEGPGKLIEPETIVQKSLDALKSPIESKVPNPLNSHTNFTNVKILVTAGGTQEPIDTVRVISNLSSGRTGISIAETLSQMGFDVTLLQSHSSQKSELIENRFVFTSFASLDEQIRFLLSSQSFSHIIHTAAVSDYSIDQLEINGQRFYPLDIKKVSSDSDSMSIHLKRNHKIVDRLIEYSQNKDLQIIAFKLTSHASPTEQKDAVAKLLSNSKANYVVHNDLTEIDIINRIHKFTIYGDTNDVPCSDLQELIAQLTRIILPKEYL